MIYVKTTPWRGRLYSTKENVSRNSSCYHLEINIKGPGERREARFITRFLLDQPSSPSDSPGPLSLEGAHRSLGPAVTFTQG